MKKLIFDIQISGHHSEYISHLIDYLYDNKDGNEYFFVVHTDFSSEFPNISRKAKAVNNIHLIEIKFEELQTIQHLGMIKKSFVEFRLMHHYALKFNVSHVCLLYFNTFQLACCFFRPKYTISGILFLQFFRMATESQGDKLRYYRKYLTTWLYSKNSKITSVFVLNDDKSVAFLNSSFHSKIFKMLPDPIPELVPLENFDIYDYYGIDKNRKVFLHIGGLGDRKGTFEILESVTHISLEHQNKVAILLVGKVVSEYAKSQILKGLLEGNDSTAVQLFWDNQFVSNAMMKSLFDQSEVVLMPYKNAEASSGILGHAAAANKLVIATGKGLLKELITDYQLGYLVDEVIPTSIASQIDFHLMSTKSNQINDTFVLTHSTKVFSEKILLTNFTI
jgi:glycosyltransferase involved in cell wall biosynthesis